MADICFVTKAWRSGSAWHAQSTVQALAAAGGQVSYVAPLADPLIREPKHANLERVVLPREIVDETSGRAKRVMASLGRIFAGWSAVFKQRFVAKTFIVTIPDPLVFSLPMFAALRLSGAHIIFLVHDAKPHAWRLRPRFRRLEMAAHGLSYRLASKIVVLTPSTRDVLVNAFGLAPEKVRVIPHGPFSIGAVAPLPGNGRLLLFGTLRRNKCVLEVIRAVTSLRQTDPALTLTLAGEPHAQDLAYWSECLAAIAEDPQGFEVLDRFIGDNELPALIGRIDAFVLAYEGFDSQSGVSVIAGLSGRPVVGTTAGGLSELFEGGLSGEIIAPPVSPDTIADAIRAFRAQPADHWRDLSEKGLERLSRTMSWDSIGASFLQVAREGDVNQDKLNK